MAKLNVALVTPERQVARVEVDMITAPSAMGQVGILPEHQPLLADLVEGPVVFKAGSSSETYALSGGFLEVDNNKVVILAETAEHTSEIDEDRAQGALSDSEKRLKGLDISDPDYDEHQSRVRRARVRLSVLGKG